MKLMITRHRAHGGALGIVPHCGAMSITLCLVCPGRESGRMPLLRTTTCGLARWRVAAIQPPHERQYGDGRQALTRAGEKLTLIFEEGGNCCECNRRVNQNEDRQQCGTARLTEGDRRSRRL